MPSTIGTTLGIPELVDLIDRRWLEKQSLIVPDAARLFNVSTKADGTGNTEMFTEFDVDTGASVIPELAVGRKNQFGVGYSKVVTLKRIGADYEISRQLRHESKRNTLGQLVDANMKNCPYRYGLDLTHVITFGNEAGYTDMDGNYVDLRTADGLPLFSDAHLLKNVADTYSNILDGDPEFSATEFENILEMNNTEDMNNFGKVVQLDYSIVFHARNVGLGNRIREVLESTGSLTDEKNAGVINPMKNGTGGRQWDTIELTHLATLASGAYDSTKAKTWGIASTGIMGWQSYAVINEQNHALPLFERENEAHLLRSRMGYAIGVCSGRGIKASFPGYSR